MFTPTPQPRLQFAERRDQARDLVDSSVSQGARLLFRSLHMASRISRERYLNRAKPSSWRYEGVEIGGSGLRSLR